MAEATVVIRNPHGLHARPAATFVRAAAGFHGGDVHITNLTRNPDKTASAKSLIAVLGLGVNVGHSIRIVADGENADAAVSSLVDLVESGLGETIEPT